MNTNINSKIFSLLWFLFGPFLTAYILISISLFLIQDGNTYETKIKTEKFNYNPKYGIKFIEKLDNKKNKTKDVETKKSLPTLKNIILKACFVDSKGGFILVYDGKKSIFLDLNQTIRGYKLDKVGANYAIFSKDGNELKLELKLEKKTAKGTDIKENKFGFVPKELVNEEKYINVKREEFKKYTKNINSVFRDIRIQPLKKDKEFLGLKITFVRKSSLFDKMGLRKGDIIKYIDGNLLKNEVEILQYYNRLDEMTTLKIGFERDKILKEVTYEID